MTLEIGKSSRVKGYMPGVRGYIGHMAEVRGRCHRSHFRTNIS